MFAGVDFDFQIESRTGCGFRLEFELQMGRVLCARDVAAAEPSESFADGVYCWSYGLGPDLHEINIFGIAKRPRKENFVDRSAAPECDPFRQERIVEQIAQCPTDDEILLDLSGFRPWRAAAPFLEIG